MSSKNSTPNLILSLTGLLIGIGNIVLKIYLNVYLYMNLIRPQFPFLPDLTMGQVWSVSFALSAIFYRHDNVTWKETTEEAFERTLQRTFVIIFAWLIAFITLKVFL